MLTNKWNKKNIKTSTNLFCVLFFSRGDCRCDDICMQLYFFGQTGSIGTIQPIHNLLVLKAYRKRKFKALG